MALPPTCVPGLGLQGRADAALLLAGAHARILRALSSRANFHFQGLQQAVRHFRGALPPLVAKRLLNLEVAHNVCRHVTGPYLTSLEEVVQSMVCDRAFEEALRTKLGAKGDEAPGTVCQGPAHPERLYEVTKVDVISHNAVEVAPVSTVVLADAPMVFKELRLLPGGEEVLVSPGAPGTSGQVSGEVSMDVPDVANHGGNVLVGTLPYGHAGFLLGPSEGQGIQADD